MAGPGPPPPAPLPPSSRLPSSFTFSSADDHPPAFSSSDDDQVFLPPRDLDARPSPRKPKRSKKKPPPPPQPPAHRARSLDYPPPPRAARRARREDKPRKTKSRHVALDDDKQTPAAAVRTKSLDYPRGGATADRSFTSLRVLGRRRCDFDAPPPHFASDSEEEEAAVPHKQPRNTRVLRDGGEAPTGLARSKPQSPILRHSSQAKGNKGKGAAKAPPPILASRHHDGSSVMDDAPAKPKKAKHLTSEAPPQALGPRRENDAPSTPPPPSKHQRAASARSPLTGEPPAILCSRREEPTAKALSVSGMSLVTASTPDSPRSASPRATPPSPAPVAPDAHVPPRLALRATPYVAPPVAVKVKTAVTSPPSSPVTLSLHSKSTTAESSASMFSTMFGSGGDAGASPIDTAPLSRVIRTPFAPLVTLTQAPLPCLPLRASPLPMLVTHAASMHLMATLLPRLLRLPAGVVESVRGGLGVGVRNAVVWAGIRGERPRKVRAVTEREEAGVRVVLGGARGGVVDEVRSAAVREFGAKGFEGVVMLGCFAGYYGAVCGLLGVEEEGGGGEGVRASLNMRDFDDSVEKKMGGRGRREGLKLMKKVRELRTIEAYWMAGVPEGEGGRCLGRILGFVPSYLECLKGREERRAFVFLIRWLVKGEAINVVVRCLMGYVLARSADNVVLTAHWAYLVERFGGEEASAMLDVVDDVGALIECRRRFGDSGRRSTIGSCVTSGDERRKTRGDTEEDEEEGTDSAEEVVRLADRPVVTEIDTEVEITDGEDTGDESDFSLRSTEERMSDLRRMMDKRVPDRPVGSRVAGNAAFELEDESDEEKCDDVESGENSDGEDAMQADDLTTFDTNGMLNGIPIACELDQSFSDGTGADDEEEDMREAAQEEHFPTFPARSSTVSGAESCKSGASAAVSAATAQSADVVADVFSKQDVAALLLAHAAARSARRSAASSRSSVPRMRLATSEASMVREDLPPAAVAEAISVVGAHVALQRLTSTYRQMVLEDVVRKFVNGPVGHELNLNNLGETQIRRRPTSRRGWKKHSLRGVEAERIL